jgi:hypothetical protein
LNILYHRKFETKSLRAGHHLPFYKAFGFFAGQCCGRQHDKVFGYLGLTNSRIKVDYSLSILDLFVATFADYMLSAGFITEDLTRRRTEMMRITHTVVSANDLTAPLLAFELEMNDPLVNLLFHTVVKFFAPGFEETFCACAASAWWVSLQCIEREEEFYDFIKAEHKFELKYIGSVCIKVVKLMASALNASTAYYKEVAARQKRLAAEDAVLTASESGESLKYSEWVARANSISDQMWRRFQESGEDADGDMEDESWTLIA